MEQLESFRSLSDNRYGSYLRANSFSGYERNRTFLSQHGNFTDVTRISGADFLQDGRGFVLLDFDNDGWRDMVVSSANEPKFRIVRNRMSELPENEGNRFATIKLVGGQDDSFASAEWSSRDAIGAVVMVTSNGQTRRFEQSIGVGLSSQNSKWLHVGLGSHAIEKIEVRWPSGKTSTIVPPETQMIEIHERPESSSASG